MPGHETDIEADSQCPRRVAFRGFITETHHDNSVREAFPVSSFAYLNPIILRLRDSEPYVRVIASA